MGQVPVLHQQLLAALHTSPVGSHSSIPVTLRRANQLFAWRGMNASVRDFVASCRICQQAKPDRSRLPSLLQQLAETLVGSVAMPDSDMICPR